MATKEKSKLGGLYMDAYKQIKQTSACASVLHLYVKAICCMRQFFLQLATQQMLHCSFPQKSPSNTPFLQPAMQQNVALQVAGRVELSSTFCNVARQVAAPV